MDFKIEKLSYNDTSKFMELISVFEVVFEMENFTRPDEVHLQALLNKEDFFVFVALFENKVIGGLTSYIMHQYYSTSPLVYIYDLAVKTEFQRKGIGRLLIDRNNSYSRSIGVEVVMVEADEEDGYAVEFYHATGAKGQKVVHFDYLIT